jgi:hypothetical protein
VAEAIYVCGGHLAAIRWKWDRGAKGDLYVFTMG